MGQAFNAVQETAVRVAVEQAELRRSVRDVFLSLARRSQALLHRQLSLLDSMERRTTDSEELAELFRVDHLATRMRRNAENLIVLSGATAGRGWRRPVPMIDVLRGALAEVEDYTRVTVLPVGPASLAGRAVGDVIHLLAELIENAVSFSPPQTVVRVGRIGRRQRLRHRDRGPRAGHERGGAGRGANEQLRHPPEFKLTSTARLGLYVVGKLAERHGIRVRLTESPVRRHDGDRAAAGEPDRRRPPMSSTVVPVDGARRPAQLAAIGAGPRRARGTRPTRHPAGRSRPTGPAAAVTRRPAARRRHRRRDVAPGRAPTLPRPGGTAASAAAPNRSPIRDSAANRPCYTPSGLTHSATPAGPDASAPTPPRPTPVRPGGPNPRPPRPDHGAGGPDRRRPDEPEPGERPGRGPEQVRSLMSSYRRARCAAATTRPAWRTGIPTSA